MDDENDAWEEIAASGRTFRNLLGVEVRTFCFPMATLSDLDQHVEMKVAQVIPGAAALHYGLVTHASDLYALPRMSVQFSNSFDFKKHVDGMEYLHQGMYRRSARITNHFDAIEKREASFVGCA